MPEHSSTGQDRTPAGLESRSRTPPAVPDHELVRCIGRGAYGEVWLARNAIGTLRAVKIVYRDAFSDARPYEREFEGIQKFEPLSRTHPGLVNILQIGLNEPAGCFYYVMELADDASVAADVRRLTSSSQVEQCESEKVGTNSPMPEASHSPTLSPAHFREEKSEPPHVGCYTPRTLASDLKAQGRLPFAQCLRTALALADALEHLHRHGLIHRDIKPANIIFVNGAPKLADIGLVTAQGEGKSWVGTEGFMPPEGPGTPQADVFSLGKVLYEISTGKDRQRFPEPLTALADLPDQKDWLEFNEVVAKACENDTKRRYASASELRAELVLLSGGKSVRRMRRAEHRLGVAKKLGLGAVGLFVVGFFILRATVGEMRARQRDLIMQDIQTILLLPHDAGWSSKVQNKARQAGRIRKDLRLQALAAASLAGVDATEYRRFTNFSAMSVVFDTNGQRLLAGGLQRGALLWRTKEARPTPLDSPGPGIVAFRPDGVAVQLCAVSATNFVLWNLETLSIQQVFRIESPRPWDENQRRKGPTLALSPDCSIAAGVATTVDNTGAFAVWDVASGTKLFGTNQVTTALAFSPDGKLLATGTEDGTVLVFSSPGGDLMASNNFSRTAVRSLAFKKTVNRHVARSSPLQNWLLAVGEAASTVRLWYLDGARETQVLRGCDNDVEAVTFNGDGTYLAAATHGGLRLFDVVSGKLLLNVQVNRLTFSAAFDPTGVLLAAGGQGEPTGSVLVHELQRKREIQVLHGLEGMVQRLCLSRDGHRVAAVAQNWRIAVWEREEGRLLHVFEAPRGVYSDLLALAFSPSGDQLAAAAGTNAVLWDLKDPHEILHRPLPHGSVDQLAFSDTNVLISFRLEREDRLGRPKSQNATNWPPQVCRIRNLVLTNWDDPIAEFNRFDWGIKSVAGSALGRYIAADVINMRDNPPRRSIEFWDGRTGKHFWSLPLVEEWQPDGKLSDKVLCIDSTGEFVAFEHPSRRVASVSRIGTLATVRTFASAPQGTPNALGPGGSIWTMTSTVEGVKGCFVFQGTDATPVVSVANLGEGLHRSLQFDVTGRFLAWGNGDGTVSVCDLKETKHRLAELDLAR